MAASILAVGNDQFNPEFADVLALAEKSLRTETLIDVQLRFIRSCGLGLTPKQAGRLAAMDLQDMVDSLTALKNKAERRWLRAM